MTAICLETEINAISFAQSNAEFTSACVQSNKIKQCYNKEKNVIYLSEVESSTSEENFGDYSKSESDQIKSIILNENWVKGVKAFEWQGAYYVSVLSKPFCLKSERDENINKLAENLKVVTKSDVYITFDLGVFRNLNEEPSESEKERYSGLIKRNGTKL